MGDSRVDAHLRNAEALVDLGCGDGSWLDAYPGSGAIGIDIDATRLRAETQPRAWTFIGADLDEGIPLEDARASAIRANQVIEHIRNPVRFVAEVHRVLRPGGVFVATTPNIRYAKHLLRLAIRGEGPMTSQAAERSAAIWDDGHIHYFTARDLEWLAKGARFHSCRTEALIDQEGRLKFLALPFADRRTNSLVLQGLRSVSIFSWLPESDS